MVSVNQEVQKVVVEVVRIEAEEEDEIVRFDGCGCYVVHNLTPAEQLKAQFWMYIWPDDTASYVCLECGEKKKLVDGEGGYSLVTEEDL